MEKTQLKQRRTRLMLEHILSRLDGNEERVISWLNEFVSDHRPSLREWQVMTDWKGKLKWMLKSINSHWDEVEWLMSNHPFSCIIDQDFRTEVLETTQQS